MLRRANVKRTAMFLVLIAFVCTTSAYGFYRYMLGKYTSQFDAMLSLIINMDSLAGSPAPHQEASRAESTHPAATPSVAPSEPNAHPSANNNPAPLNSTVTTQAPSSQTQPAAPTQGQVNATAATAPSTQGSDLDLLNQAAAAGFELSSAEQAEAASLVSLFNQTTLQEKLFIFSKVNRFSPSELFEMFQLYMQVDSDPTATQKIRDKLSEKFTQQDIEEIKALALKYVGD